MARMLKRWPEIAASLIVLIARVASMPRTPWENDEFLFILAVQRFEPLRFHPHPPGYPLFVLAGKALAWFVGDPFFALVTLGIAASIVAFIAADRLFELLTGDRWLALAGALLVSFSPAMIVDAPLALSDSAAFASLTVALWAMARASRDDVRFAALAGAFASAAIGFRPQLLIPLVPAAMVALFSMRRRVVAVVVFAAVSTAWFVPLVIAAGGVSNLVNYETRQAAYVAAHDASMSRGRMSPGEIATRFVLHPWGPKTLSFPIVILAVLGAIVLLLHWRRAPNAAASRFAPLLVFTAIQLVFELSVMDPADGVRYAIPTTLLVALLAAAGLASLSGAIRIPPAAVAVAVVFALAAWMYVRPITSQRHTSDSPPVEAAAYIRRTLTPGGVVLHDASLTPHADLLLAGYRRAGIDEGLRSFYDSPETPLMLFVNGGSTDAAARVFAWRPSDAYGKLTRNFYRIVTAEPLPPARRFLPLSGVYAPERTIDGDAWRWLARSATIRLPQPHARHVELTFRLSPDVGETNRVRLFVEDRAAGEVVVVRGRAAAAVVSLEPDDATIRIESERDVSAGAVAGNRDPRRIAIQLVSVVQR